MTSCVTLYVGLRRLRRFASVAYNPLKKLMRRFCVGAVASVASVARNPLKTFERRLGVAYASVLTFPYTPTAPSRVRRRRNEEGEGPGGEWRSDAPPRKAADWL